MEIHVYNYALDTSIDVKMDESALDEKSSFKRQGLTFLLNWIVKKQIGALVRSRKFLPPELALYLYKSTIRPYMEYCCHV